MTTLTMPKAMIEKFQREQAAERDRDRADALAELKKIEAELPSICKPHDDAIAQADAELEKARETLQRAQERSREARRQRLSAVYPTDRRQELLRARLADELRHASITGALAEIAAIEDERRVIPDEDASAYAYRAKLLTWCRETRQQLLALQFSDADPSKSVGKLMQSRP